MEREIPRHQPESDVPELEVIRSQEDKEVIAEREIPLHEEMGFDSAAQMEQARTMQAALLKEKDMAKADQLRAELKALLDDSDGEPMPTSARSGVEDLLAAAREQEAQQRAKTTPYRPVPVDSPLEQAIGQAEYDFAITGPVAFRAGIESVGIDQEEAEAAESLIRLNKRTLINPIKGTDETKIEKRGREAFEQAELKKLQQVETESEKQARLEKERKDYENAQTQAYEADEQDERRVA